MNRIEYIAVVAGLIVGYLIVNNYLSRPKVQNSTKKNPDSSNQVMEEDFTNKGVVHWSITLDVSSTATVDEIRKAYKTQMKMYHPDKVAALGNELKELAERKSKDINIAYKRAMNDRGIGEQFW